jgi:CelD/BcsL family acetyltransferase involved in cellulose biosynthesis
VLHVTPITTFEGLERLRPAWIALYESTRAANPFAHPDWLLSWARQYVGERGLYVLAVQSAGELVGVAPFSRRTRSLLGRRVTSIRPLGGGRHSQLIEMPQVLAARRDTRPVLRTVVAHLGHEADEWDWAEIELGPGQGWFEREWIPTRGAGSGSVALHKGTRAFVVLPLASTWDELRHGLKRNVKESIRRGANRLGREGHEWELREPGSSPQEVDRALAKLVALHRERASLDGTEPHPDYFADRREEVLLHSVGRTMNGSGCFTPLTLAVDGEEVAARLVLETPDTVFFSVSGFDPRWWRHNVATTLLALALRRSIDRGRTVANLSHGPDVSKLRWSEQLDFAHSFLLVGERLRSRLAFEAFWHMRAEYLRRDQRQRQIRRRQGRRLPEPV